MLLIAGPGASPARADIAVLQTVPVAGSTLTAPITEVRLSFTRAVHANYSSVEVTGPDGADYASGDLDVFMDLNIVQPVRHLAPGTYRVSWSAGVAAPGEAQGQFDFTVPEAALMAVDDKPAAVAYDNPNSGPGVWLVLGGLAGLVVVLWVVLIVRRSKRELAPPPYRGDRGMDF
ncbi:Copper-binding protein CopC (methionine-rich) [Paractinoplanes atraurantiacus]|uniref:Copper-binding protein CopC (Methionine-rich) n=1 Tax=Paractinoplanes atraurantiacus TaxID=1036182 RepID=A0A285KFL4_9ACTN|nr:Copper-binding protein CopC (methionine-rich) [Actinoplanes atraurantiacus]